MPTCSPEDRSAGRFPSRHSSWLTARTVTGRGSMNGINVTARLRKVIEHATQYDPDKRPKDVEAFKRELDKATPRVSLRLHDDGSLASPDGSWLITRTVERRGGHAVDVKRDGGRRSVLCQKGLTDKAATKHVRTVLKLLAEHKPESKLI